MDIVAASPSVSTGYIPTTTGVGVARTELVARDPGGSSASQRSAQSSAAETAGNTTPPEKKAQGTRESQGNNASSSLALNPHIKFKDSEGTRVMDVYDSKSVLIYQIPPKGALTLIHNRENMSKSQVETSA